MKDYQPKTSFMLLPSLACQAKCVYCFGPNKGPIMHLQVFDAVLDWIEQITPPYGAVDITFHGGEPLIASKGWYDRSLPLLRQRFGHRLKLSMQSNLWLLDDRFCDLFREYDVSLGTSLDGPQHLNDLQRGEGYFAKTMAGIQTARRNGLGVGVICTFTRQTALHYQEVFEFFANQGLSFSVHAAVSTLGKGQDIGFALTPDEHADLFIKLFDYYLDNITRIQISTFDSIAKGLSAQDGAICTFGDCLGGYLTIGSRGEIFSCNRFAHHPEWQLGSVVDLPDLNTLVRSEAWQKLRQRGLTVHESCKDCQHFAYCKGGCPYNAFTSGSERRDPHCTAYKRLFEHITERALDEVFSEENMSAVVQHGPRNGSLMRKGKLLQVMTGDAHPQEIAKRAREIVAAIALAVSDTVEDAVDKLDRAGIVTNHETALGSLQYLRNTLENQSKEGLVNAYLHVTYACNLECAHCYASSSPEQSLIMTVDNVQDLIWEVARAGFRKAVLTGGEPMTHPQRYNLLDALSDLRESAKPLQLVLRTNLAYRLSPDLIMRLANSTDQVIVSVDGDEVSHDARRGTGTYARIVSNLHTLLSVGPTAEFGITAVLTADQIDGREGEAVHALGDKLGVQVRFKTVLPIGRGSDLRLKLNYHSLLDDSTEALAHEQGPMASCGLGMNLYVGPRGETFPCHAVMGDVHYLGNAFTDGLTRVLQRNDVYRNVTVDSNAQCRHCPLRYVCGGFCRAWAATSDPNAPPIDCTTLQERAHGILLGALEVLDVDLDLWRASDLPLLNSPPFRKQLFDVC